MSLQSVIPSNFTNTIYFVANNFDIYSLTYNSGSTTAMFSYNYMGSVMPNTTVAGSYIFDFIITNVTTTQYGGIMKFNNLTHVAFSMPIAIFAQPTYIKTYYESFTVQFSKLLTSVTFDHNRAEFAC